MVTPSARPQLPPTCWPNGLNSPHPHPAIPLLKTDSPEVRRAPKIVNKVFCLFPNQHSRHRRAVPSDNPAPSPHARLRLRQGYTECRTKDQDSEDHTSVFRGRRGCGHTRLFQPGGVVTHNITLAKWFPSPRVLFVYSVFICPGPKTTSGYVDN